MKFVLRKSSDWSYQEEIEINSLDALMGLVEDYGQEIIVSKSDENWYLEIYDGHRE